MYYLLKGFTHTSHLAKQKNFYSEEKQDSCEICQKSFTVRASLTSHNKCAAHLNTKWKGGIMLFLLIHPILLIVE